jgi:hypothetical protein
MLMKKVRARKVKEDTLDCLARMRQRQPASRVQIVTVYLFHTILKYQREYKSESGIGPSERSSSRRTERKTGTNNTERSVSLRSAENKVQ